LSKNAKVRLYKTLILPLALWGYETWSLTLKEEHRLRVFENRVLRRIFGPKKYEVTGGWRKLPNEKLHNLYSAKYNENDQVMEDEMGRLCSMNWAKKHAYRILMGKSKGKRPLGRPRCGWVDNIIMDLREIGWGGMDWIDLAQDRDQWRALVNTAMNLWVS
jgi:hypothetical protein